MGDCSLTGYKLGELHFENENENENVNPKPDRTHNMSMHVQESAPGWIYQNHLSGETY